MKKILYIICAFVITTISFAQKTWSDPQITAKDIKAHIFYLASDEMKGRFTGTDEERMAGNYIKVQFQSYGLSPLISGSYFQEFPFIEKVELTGSNTLSTKIEGKQKSLQVNKEFITAPFSGKGNFSTNLVFAGYGISASKLNYDDYDGIDVSGKVVVALRYHPEHDSAKSEFDRYASYRQKASAARDKGAVGIIFVNGYLPRNDEDQLMELRYDGAGSIKDFSVLQVKRNIIDDIFKKEGFNLAEIQKNIDGSKKPSSIEFPKIKVTLSTEVKEVEKVGRNVVAYLEGTDPLLKSEYIVVGAHYDHLGIDQLKTSSMYKGNDPQIHNGADDNASGTTGLLELAEKFGAHKNELKRSIIFIAFSGEELGLLGSSYFTNNSPIAMDKIVAMLNMDMVGRLNEEKSLTVIGAGTSSVWKNLLNEKNKYDFKLTLSDGGSGGSDHQAFTNKNIPVLFFFTGTHTDYHKPSDDAEKINLDGQSDVINYVYSIADAIQQSENRPDFVKVEEPAQRNVPRSRVTVGTVPEFGYNGNGYKVSGVTEGGPAAKGGMIAGDIIIKFGSKTVNNIYDFMYAMGEYSPGDKVDVVVQRDGKEVTLNLELITK
ncbi:MAG: M28 family peptidase [Melioribacteraceae bacterium]|nr:M28 family peptidase [Melioribacteraceae bacterium]